MNDDRAPLLRHSSSSSSQASLNSSDVHTQFCILAGITPSNLPKDSKWPKPSRTSIYQRAKRRQKSQNVKYLFTATMTNSLLLSQIIIGAVLTALGASNSPSIYVAIFGALNTVIAGLVTYLKSRGQPMRARMFGEDLERVIDEVENSEAMWLGIARNMHGYNAIDTEDKVSVRSEVARLTRLYDKAVRNNAHNNPDSYLNSTAAEDPSGLKSKPAPVPTPAPVDAAPSTAPAPAQLPTPTLVPAPAPAPVAEPDESPATAAKVTPPTPAPSKDDKPVDSGDSMPATDAPASQVPNGSASPAANGNKTATPPTATGNSETDPLATDIDEGPVTMDIPDKKPKQAKDESGKDK